MCDCVSMKDVKARIAEIYADAAEQKAEIDRYAKKQVDMLMDAFEVVRGVMRKPEFVVTQKVEPEAECCEIPAVKKPGKRGKK